MNASNNLFKIGQDCGILFLENMHLEDFIKGLSLSNDISPVEQLIEFH